MIITKRDPSNRENPCQIWLEDFCIIGCGATTDEAVKDAVRNLLRAATVIHDKVVSITEEETNYGE